ARLRYLSGSSRFPLAAPLALGTYAWGPPRSGGDGMAALLGALMHGAVGYSACMAVARDRWIGAAIDDTGHLVRALAEPLGRLPAALTAAGWSALEHRADLALLVPREYLRLDLAPSPLGPLAPLAEWLRMGRAGARTDDFGFQGPIPRELHETTAALIAAM